jgi:hypothetical protein
MRRSEETISGGRGGAHFEKVSTAEMNYFKGKLIKQDGWSDYGRPTVG